MDSSLRSESDQDQGAHGGSLTPSSSTSSASQLNVPRFAPHQPSIASPLRASVHPQHSSSGSEEATPTQTPGESPYESRPSEHAHARPSGPSSMASRAHAYLEAWKDGSSSSWSATPAGTSHALPLHHSPQKLFSVDQKQHADTSYFALSPSDPSIMNADQANASRWAVPLMPSRQTLAPSDLEPRTDGGIEARKHSFGSSSGGGGIVTGGYASSVDADFYSAPPSRLVSRTPTPVSNVAGAPRFSSPDIAGSTDSDDECSDYGAPSGWSETLFGLGGRNATGNRFSRSSSKHSYHSLGTRRGSKWKDVEPDTTLVAHDYVSPRSKGRSTKGFERSASLSALASSTAPDVRRRQRRRKNESSNIPTPLRVISSLLSKTFRTFFGPIHPITIIIALGLIAGFVTSVTMLIIYILNPDKEPLPWRTYCQQQMPFPHAYADALAPVNVMVGVMTIDSKYERRNIIRNTYARHTLPTDANGQTLANVQVKFVLGKVRKAHAKRVALEMEAYNDIVILDLDETQSARKTHAYLRWASENATVPFLRPVGPAKGYNGSLADTFIPSTKAPGGLTSWEYDSRLQEDDRPTAEVSADAGSADNEKMRYQVAWKKVDYVVKADDDSFIVLDELERHLRVSPRRMTYWGYLIKNWFMGGEAYALSFDLVEWLARSPDASRTAKGKEDTRTPQWLAMHPNRSSINWVSEHCWIYDHPKAGSPYSHGYLFPDYVEKIKLEARHGLSEQEIAYRGGERRSQSYSTVSKWHQKYTPPRRDMTVEEEVEALVEGGGRWEGTWVRGPDGSTSETWVPYHDIVYQSDDVRLRPSATDARGNAVLASDMGLEPYSGLPIYGPVDRSNAARHSSPQPEVPVSRSEDVERPPPRRDLLGQLSSLPHRLLGYRSEEAAKAQKIKLLTGDDGRSVPFAPNSVRVLPRPTPKDSYGEWASLRASRYLNRSHGGTVIVHYLKKTELWLETALALSGKPKLWTNGAGGRGKEWRMGGSPLVRADGFISEGRSAPRRAVIPAAPSDEGEDSTSKAATDSKKSPAAEAQLSDEESAQKEVVDVAKAKAMAPKGNTPF